MLRAQVPALATLVAGSATADTHQWPPASPVPFGVQDVIRLRSIDELQWSPDGVAGLSHSENAHHMYDLAGNAAEWCLEPSGGGVLLGGSYRSWKADLRLSVVARGGDAAAGLRVVREP